MLQIKLQLESFLEQNGIKEIEVDGKKFDPNFHEVVSEVESKKDPGTIIEEIQKGYKFDGRVIRRTKVRVSKFKN